MFVIGARLFLPVSDTLDSHFHNRNEIESQLHAVDREVQQYQKLLHQQQQHRHQPVNTPVTPTMDTSAGFPNGEPVLRQNSSGVLALELKQAIHEATFLLATVANNKVAWCMISSCTVVCCRQQLLVNREKV